MSPRRHLLPGLAEDADEGFLVVFLRELREMEVPTNFGSPRGNASAARGLRGGRSAVPRHRKGPQLREIIMRDVLHPLTGGTHEERVEHITASAAKFSARVTPEKLHGHWVRQARPTDKTAAEAHPRTSPRMRCEVRLDRAASSDVPLGADVFAVVGEPERVSGLATRR